MLHKRF
jgi:hypothetical protein